MSQLIEKLKLDHVELSDLFLEIVLLDISPEEGQKKLLDAKAALFAHLQKEDDEFYPVLWEIAKDNPDLKLKLESSANDMGSVRKVLLAFFKKYADGEHRADFQIDFRNIYAILTKRITSEESDLFPIYEQSKHH